MTKIEKELRERLAEIETRLAVLEALPRPIVWVVGVPAAIEADMQPPSELEH